MVVFVSLLMLALSPLRAASSAEPNDADIHFALLRYPGGNWNPRPHGLPRMAWEIRRRTSIATSLEVATVDLTSEALFNEPFVVWQGDSAFPPFSAAAVNALRQYLNEGGTLLIDISDGIAGGGFDLSMRRELSRIFPDTPVVTIPADHVLYKAFYLLDRHGGRVLTHSYLEGVFVHNRLSVIISSNDLAGAVARDEFGAWEYDVGASGNAAREMTFRLAVNVMMYALCLDYKEDQVHIPFILQRRR